MRGGFPYRVFAVFAVFAVVAVSFSASPFDSPVYLCALSDASLKGLFPVCRGLLLFLAACFATPDPGALALELNMAPQLEEHPDGSGDTSARFVRGEHVRMQADESVQVRGHGEVRTPATVIKGDVLQYDADTDRAHAYGPGLYRHHIAAHPL